MFRLVILPFLVVPMTGCLEGSASPGDLPKGAMGAVYTTAQAQPLAACIALRLHSTVQSVDDQLVVDSPQHPGLSYSIGANRKGSVYPTQIAIIGGDSGRPEAKDVSACLNAEVTDR